MQGGLDGLAMHMNPTPPHRAATVDSRWSTLQGGLGGIAMQCALPYDMAVILLFLLTPSSIRVMILLLLTPLSIRIIMIA